MKTFNSNIDEPQLIARLKQQDRYALAYIIEHYSDALYGAILRIVKKETIAEEVLQDTFLKIWNSIDQYSATRGRLFTWMFKLACNLAIDKLRSKEIQRDLKTDDVADHLQQINNNGFDQQQTDGIGVEQLLSSLPPEQSHIISLLYLKGYTHAQIAEEYQLPLGTVKTRHRMALIRLRELLVKEL